jgi:hypothetical protein
MFLLKPTGEVLEVDVVRQPKRRWPTVRLKDGSEIRVAPSCLFKTEAAAAEEFRKRGERLNGPVAVWPWPKIPQLDRRD